MESSSHVAAAGHAPPPHHDPLQRSGVRILGPRLDAVDLDMALARVAQWAERGEARYVVACNVHSVVTAGRESALMRAINGADLAVADGAPVAWLMRRLGCAGQRRVAGPDLMWRYLEYAAARQEPIYLCGGTQEMLERLSRRLASRFPGLRIAGSHAPPFRPLTEEEDAALVDHINASGARTVWVALGCPKQEVWMAQHRGRIRAVQVGVGAAFAFHAGMVRRAPRWMQRSGLEWLHRLASEPRRLARRYVLTNSLFVVGAVRTLLGRS